MNRFIVGIVIISIAIILTGCTEERQVAQINKKIAEATELEKNFIAKQNELNETKQAAQQLYMEIIALTLEDEEIIDEKRRDADALTEKQEKVLEEAVEEFQRAYEKFSTIDKNINKVQSAELKENTMKLLTIMEDRKELIDSYFDTYHERLEIEKAFYRELDRTNLDFKALDGHIDHLNKLGESMEKTIQQFNSFTEQYIEVVKNEELKLTSID